MEHYKELIFTAVSTILFCTAVSLLFYQAATYQQTLFQIEERYRSMDALYEAENSVSELTSYAELIMSLCGTLEYDIQIDGRLIKKEEHSIDQIDGYFIPRADYTKSYLHDEDGNLIRIVYWSATDLLSED